MGINITLSRYPDGRRSDPTDTDWWDSCRHVGDKEFVSSMTFKKVSLSFKYSAQDWIFRPLDFKEAREWADDYYARVDYEHGKKRISELLDRLEEDPDLWVKMDIHTVMCSHHPPEDVKSWVDSGECEGECEAEGFVSPCAWRPGKMCKGICGY